MENYRGTLVVIYRLCIEMDEYPVEKMVSEIREIVENNDVRNFILDIRGNLGGKSRIIEPLIVYLKNTNLNIVTLVDSLVFSSGAFVVRNMQDLGSIFIGEGIGTTLNHFGDCYDFFLPQTNTKIRYSTKYFDLSWKNNVSVTTKKEVEKIFQQKVEPVYFIPDICVLKTLENYKDKKDSVFQKAIEYINCKDKEKSYR